MKTTLSRLAKGSIIAAMSLVAMPAVNAQEVAKADWGDFKLYLDPGHAGTENGGIWGYSEAEKVLQVAHEIKNMLETYTTAVDVATDAENGTFKLCRYTQSDQISLEARSDEANAWGADFYYSIHSDASGSVNTIVCLFGGWSNAGEKIEKTPNGGKAYGEFLEPNLMGVMRVGSRGNLYDRCYYDKSETHTNQYPYLSVNRRSNMPSLLSEGGYHDMAVQQRRNMNADYKRLEGFAAFQSLMQYRGFALPEQTFMTGVISNSENGQPINGATITVGDKTYTTDTFESLFHKYTKNPNLISNGFYIFEGLTAGETYDVTISADGYDGYTGTIKINDEFKTATGVTSTPQFVTFLDVELTNNRPAVVASVSAEDLGSVNSIKPLVLTFSRNMDRASVEQALSINNKGEITHTWENDYTLVLDITKLKPYMTYKLTIDASIAKNSQTGQLLDGNGDGTPGDNYTLTFTMAEPDVEAPYIRSSYPAADGESLYTQRPPIRIEFNEELAFNGDKHGDCVVVKDATGKQYEGVLTHAVVRDRSVLHFYLKEDLPQDIAVAVFFQGGVPDLWGNVSKFEYFRFLTEYRTQTKEDVMASLEDVTGWWAPGGSGSSNGLVIDDCFTTSSALTPSLELSSSLCTTYVFDESAEFETDDEGNQVFDKAFYIRTHWPNGNTVPNRRKDLHGILSVWVYGDGSNNEAGISVRANPDGVKQTEPMKRLDYIGWDLYAFDMWNGEVSHISGTETTLQNNTWFVLDALTMRHHYCDPDNEEVPYEEWTGQIYYSNVMFSQWDDTAVRKAQLSDLDEIIVSGVEGITINENAPVEYFNLQGVRVAEPENGIYIRRQGSNVSKVVIR